MRLMTLYIIANPHAGNHQAQATIDQVKDLTKEKVRTFFTRWTDDEKYQVEEVLKFYRSQDSLLIIGGDGTLSKVLFHLPSHIPFAYYPVGSGNDFARALKLPDLQEILNSIEKNQKHPLTVFGYEKGLMLNSLDLGFAAYVVNEAADSKLKHFLNRCHLGKLTYILVAIKSLLKNPTASLTYQQTTGSWKTIENHFFFSIANNTYFGGGITIWPTATVFEDSLHLVYAKGDTFNQRIKILLSLISRKHQASTTLCHEELEQISLEIPSETIVEIDGEILEVDKLTLSRQTRYIYL